MDKKAKLLWLSFFLILMLQSALWVNTRSLQARWLNVPPVPSVLAVQSAFLGDTQLAYRASSVMLQNLGDESGRVTSLKDYDYQKLGQWFNLLSMIDPISDYIPYIAAFYYGGIEGHPDKTKVLVNYLYKIGRSGAGQKWRWLAHAVYLSRYKMEDTEGAYKMALDLAEISKKSREDMPVWTRHMPAYIMADKGEKEAAYDILLEILKSSAQDLHPNEVAHTKAYICEVVLSKEEAKENPLCAEGL